MDGSQTVPGDRHFTINSYWSYRKKTKAMTDINKEEYKALVLSGGCKRFVWLSVKEAQFLWAHSI